MLWREELGRWNVGFMSSTAKYASPQRGQAQYVNTECAILHNLCKRRNIPQPDDDDDDDGDQHDNEFGCVEPSGLAFRDHFENTF